MRKSLKKLVAMGLIATSVLSLTACGSSSSKNEGTNTPAASQPAASGDKVSIRFSWWGGDTRHAATQEAVKAFMKANPNVEVNMEYGSWDGWEKGMSTAFYGNTAPDVNQINWNWISSFSSDGKLFVDLNTVSDVLDLTQFDQAALDQCKIGDSLQAVPVSMTGRIFYWNKTVFEKAGIATPTTYEELLAAGKTFKDTLGDDYYPLALGEYDRMILMVYYLESVYGKNWVEDGKLNYTEAEITEGLKFIQKLEENHVIPTVAKLTGDGADSLDKNQNWIDGHYAGIFEWDSSASKFQKALDPAQNFELVVGDYFKDFGKYQGGYTKVSLAFAITNGTKYTKECAELLNFLLNEEEGVKLMSSERGIPLSKAALEICKTNNLLDATVAEANGKVLDWCQFQLDPTFEDSKLKSTDGVYYQAMQDLSYDNDVEGAAKTLVDGINDILGN